MSSFLEMFSCKSDTSVHKSDIDEVPNFPGKKELIFSTK